MVYSTCSVYEEENELVAQAVLGEHKDFELKRALPFWQTRGHACIENGEFCVRADPSSSHTIGFFIALFQRTADSAVRSPSGMEKLTCSCLLFLTRLTLQKDWARGHSLLPNKEHRRQSGPSTTKRRNLSFNAIDANRGSTD